MLARKAQSAIRFVRRKLDPVERAFERAWPLIEPVPGLLVSPHQERWMFTQARHLPDKANIVEIGSFKGRSTCCFALGCGDSRKRVFAIDTFNGNDVDFHHRDFFDQFQQNLRRAGVLDRVTPCRGLSHEVVKTWDRPIDLLFIDGSHEYEDVLADFNGFFPHVIPGGIVAFHDFDEQWPGVVRAWNQDINQHLVELDACRTIVYGRKPR